MADFWLDERGRREQKEKLGKQRLRREQQMRVKNNYVPNQPIIPLKDDLPPDGAPISDDYSSDCDSFVEIKHSVSEGDLFEDVAPAAPQSPCPVQSEEPNIAP